MMDTIRVLVVDDEEPVRESLRLWFEASKAFAFQVDTVEGPERCVDLEGSPHWGFDVCVIDLGFGGDGNLDYVGHRMVLGLSCVRGGGMAIVYSGYPQLSNVVRAMQLGARDFVAKADCPPHKFVEHVERLLIDLERRDKEGGLISRFLRDQREALSRRYAGRVVAIVVDESQPRVVADGRSRLDALLRYADLWRGGAHARWPVDPHLHIVPPAITP